MQLKYLFKVIFFLGGGAFLIIMLFLSPKTYFAGCVLSMSVRGWVGPGELRCMHVQGISHWAPANIGPYSQCTTAGTLLHVSGQIALIPGLTLSSFTRNI